MRAESGKDYFFHCNGKLTIYTVVLWQISHFECSSTSIKNFPSSRFQQTEYTFDESCFSAAIRTDDAQKVPVVNGEVYVAQYRAAVIAGTEILYFNKRRTHLFTA